MGDEGANLLDGGLGTDTASYEKSTSSVAAVLLNPDGSGMADLAQLGEDTLINIENLIGSQFDDLLVGNASDNIITA
ncbi:hypothetical protein [Methylobacillus glycogenes]|uniref:hypothetical protein n=1 Tax=Methylobacillus glycogenes TaxID=406 RepID=UPI0004726588|nr:hypothetical protein [Methylobacillus glycogenes]